MREPNDDTDCEVHPAPGPVTDPLATGDRPTAGPPAIVWFGRWWRGRYGVRLLLEVALVAVLLVLYNAGRSMARPDSLDAFANARRVLTFEDRIGLGFEDEIQRLTLSHRWLISFVNHYYVRIHFPATLLFFVVAFIRAPRLYRPVRRLFVAVTGSALVLHLAIPLAPPRMLPGFVDTISVWGPAIYDDPKVVDVANQFAAMPSLHFGWAVMVAGGTIMIARGSWRWWAAAHPVLTLFTIIATANHFWLDAAIAMALIVAFVPLCLGAALRRPEAERATTPQPSDDGPVTVNVPAL